MWCRFVGASGVITANDGGIVAVARNGVGDYTVQLARAVHPSEVDVSVTALDATARTHTIEHLSPTLIRIRFS